MEQSEETLKFADLSTVELVSNSVDLMPLSEKEGNALSDQAEFNQQHSDPSLTILELEAEPSAQFRDNYRIAAVGDVGLSLKAGAAAGAFSVMHKFLVGSVDMSTLTPALVIVAFICLFRFLFVRKKAIALAKTKYVLTDTEMTALGPDSTKDWTVPITEIKKVAATTHKGKFRNLAFSTGDKTYFIGGLANADMLLERLPQEVKVGGTLLEEKLSAIAASNDEFGDSAEINKVRNYENLQQRIVEEVQHLPNTLLLNTITKSAIDSLIRFMLLTVLVIAGIAFGWASYLVPCSPLLAIIFASRIASLQKSIDCIYVVCPDALFEIDRGGSQKRIPLDRISMGSEELENGSTSIIIDSWIRIPVKLDDAGFESLKIWLKNYPR